jgi:Xaa-Pro aminopeptidase
MNANVKVAEAGFSAAPQAIQEGLRETVVAAAIQSAFQQSPAASRIERNYGFFYCMSGPNSAKAAAAYARTRQRIVEANDLVMIHANTCGDGYWTDITRTWTVSEPTQKQANMRAAIMEARLAALEVIRPGRHARDVDQAARSVLVKHGYGKEFKHPLGHGVGFAAANAKGRPRIHPASPDVLEAGMTFNVEPAIYFDGYGGMRHCDVVAVTSIGVKVMTDF